MKILRPKPDCLEMQTKAAARNDEAEDEAKTIRLRLRTSSKFWSLGQSGLMAVDILNDYTDDDDDDDDDGSGSDDVDVLMMVVGHDDGGNGDGSHTVV